MNLFWIILFSVCAMLVNTAGIFAICKNKKYAERVKEYCMCFSAGMLITSPLIMTLPQAVSKNHAAGLVALLGFLFMYFSNQMIRRRTERKELAFGVTAVEGIFIHSLLDGIIYAVTFNVSVTVGVLSGLGLVVHEFAEGIITFSTLQHGGLSRKKAGVVAFFVSALSTPIGALLAIPVMRFVNDTVLGLMLGFVSGVLIFISASHLLPEAIEHEKKHSSAALILGIAVALFVAYVGH